MYLQKLNGRSGFGYKTQALHDRLGKPLVVRSAYRSPEHNRAVGGAARSKHLDGAAFDIAMANLDPVAFEAAAREIGLLGFGFYPAIGFHAHRPRPHAPMGRALPRAPGAVCARDPAGARGPGAEPHFERRWRGGRRDARSGWRQGAQQVLAETQTAVLPLVPYLDTLRWVFIAVALIGIAVTIYAHLDGWRRGRR